MHSWSPNNESREQSIFSIVCWHLLVFFQEFQTWKGVLSKDQQADATSFFTVIRRSGDIHDEDSAKVHDLKVVPYSKEYASILKEASNFLHKAGDSAETPR